MTLWRLSPVLLVLLGCGTGLVAQGDLKKSADLDLTSFGYKPPPPRPYLKEGVGPTDLLDFDANGDVVVGFVGPQSQLASRSDTGLTLHVVLLTSGLTLVAQLQTSAESWHEDSVIATNVGDLVVRTGSELKVLSTDGKILAERRLSLPGLRIWRVFPIPDRRAVMVTGLSDHCLAFDAKTLSPLPWVCAIPGAPFTVSFASHTTLFWITSSDPLLAQVQAVSETGATKWNYQWRGDPRVPTLITDDRMIIYRPNIVMVHDGTEEWRVPIDAKHDKIAALRASADGEVVAALVQRVSGGSRVLDTAPKLKAERLVVIDARSGRTIQEIPIPLPASILNHAMDTIPRLDERFEFTISSDGHMIATLSDGNVRLVRVMR